MPLGFLSLKIPLALIFGPISPLYRNSRGGFRVAFSRRIASSQRAAGACQQAAHTRRPARTRPAVPRRVRPKEMGASGPRAGPRAPLGRPLGLLVVPPRVLGPLRRVFEHELDLKVLRGQRRERRWMHELDIKVMCRYTGVRGGEC